MALNKTLKTNTALTYIQDSIISGEPILITEFRVSEQFTANITPNITLQNIKPVWYTASLSSSPFSVGTSLRLSLQIPAGEEALSGKVAKEIYIIASYRGTTFLFGVLQATETDIPYYSTSALYFTVVFTLSADAQLTLVIESEVLEYSISLLSSAWSGSTVPYYQDKSIVGLLSTDTPLISLVQSGNYITSVNERDSYNRIFRAVSAVDTLTFYAEKEISIDLNLHVKIVRT